MSGKPAILFVCLGNICRSPLAEGAMRLAAAQSGLAIEIDSAGTAGWHVGKPPDPRAVSVAAANGVDISGLRARQVNPRDFVRFSHVLALDARNLTELKALAPLDAPAELHLLMDLVPGMEGHAVADPYYGDEDDFARAWREVSQAAYAIAARFADQTE